MTKRRCAGCHAVIDGRANRRWCSNACRLRTRRKAETCTKIEQVAGPVSSVIRSRSNGTLIAAVARLGYLGGPEDVVLDVTYGRGFWWTRYRPPGGLDVLVSGDFRALQYVDNCSRVICYDPPYISTGSRATSSVDSFYDRYGLGEVKGWRDTRAMIDAGLAECARVLKPGGYLLVKVMDYVESGHKVWNTFHVYSEGERLGLRLLDRFVHLSGGGPQTMTNLDGSPRQQQHAREVSSMLLVFTK